MDPEKISQLEKFVDILKADPKIIHVPELEFFKQYLLSVGATIAPQEEAEPIEGVDAGKMDAEKELVPVPPSGPTMHADQIDSLKAEASQAVGERAIELLGRIISAQGATAMLLTKRADALLKIRKPLSAIAHCEAAIHLHPDSGKAFRIRGLARRALQEWEKAHSDLAKSQAIDFDDEVENVKRFVYSKLPKKVAKINVREVEEVSPNSGGMPNMSGMGGMGGMPNMSGMPNMGGMPGMPDLGNLFSDPDIMAAMGNPKVMAAMTAMMTNPAAFMEFQNDPEVGPVLAKLMSKMGQH